MSRKKVNSTQKTKSSQRRSQELRERITIIAVVAGVALIVLAVLILPNIINNQRAQENIQMPSQRTYPNAKGMAMGDPNAPVKVVEYSDFQCVYCKNYALTEEATIMEKYLQDGKVYFVYKPFSFIGPDSVAAAEAGYCAAAQDKFFPFRDMVFTNTTEGDPSGFTRARLIAYAGKAGLDVNTFTQCYDSGKYSQQVQDDLKEGYTNNVKATPSFLVNGKLVGLDTLAAVLAAALKQ